MRDRESGRERYVEGIGGKEKRRVTRHKEPKADDEWKRENDREKEITKSAN